MKKLGILLIILLIVGATLFIVGSIRMNDVETASYKTISSNKPFSIREYPPMIVAQVVMEGERKEAVQSGFRALADFIFGNNTAATKIEMTAPVGQQSENINMTAPVSQQAQDNKWTIQFIMPSKFTMETLPKPNNNTVKITELPTRKYVAIRFSGLSSQSNLQKHKAMLDAHVDAEGITTKGEAIYAFYNHPWTLPILRRNEIMYELAP